jgi:hypothetical protein
MLFILLLYVSICAIKRIKTKYTFEYSRDFRNMKQTETISKSIDSNIFTSIPYKGRIRELPFPILYAVRVIQISPYHIKAE